MGVADKFFDGNGEFSMDMKPWGQGPEQHKIRQDGLPYLRSNYPALSYFKKCEVVTDYSSHSNNVGYNNDNREDDRRTRGVDNTRGFFFSFSVSSFFSSFISSFLSLARKEREEERRRNQEKREERRRRREEEKERRANLL